MSTRTTERTSSDCLNTEKYLCAVSVCNKRSTWDKDRAANWHEHTNKTEIIVVASVTRFGYSSQFGFRQILVGLKVAKIVCDGCLGNASKICPIDSAALIISNR